MKDIRITVSTQVPAQLKQTEKTDLKSVANKMKKITHFIFGDILLQETQIGRYASKKFKFGDIVLY